MSQSSYTDIKALWELSLGHIIEFFTYSLCFGGILGRNTVIWEVKNY